MHSISNHTIIHARPVAVYEALTTMQGIGNWWARGSAIRHEGSRKSRYGNNSRKVVTTIRIDDFEPDTYVAWTVLTSDVPGNWAGSTVTFELTPKGDDTELSFFHQGLSRRDHAYERIKTTWSGYIAELKKYVEESTLP